MLCYIILYHIILYYIIIQLPNLKALHEPENRILKIPWATIIPIWCLLLR
jgi:hypothetical protein